MVSHHVFFFFQKPHCRLTTPWCRTRPRYGEVVYAVQFPAARIDVGAIVGWPVTSVGQCEPLKGCLSTTFTTVQSSARYTFFLQQPVITRHSQPSSLFPSRVPAPKESEALLPPSFIDCSRQSRTAPPSERTRHRPKHRTHQLRHISLVDYNVQHPSTAALIDQVILGHQDSTSALQRHPPPASSTLQILPRRNPQ